MGWAHLEEEGLDEAADDDAVDLEVAAPPAAPATSESRPREPLLTRGGHPLYKGLSRGSQPVVGHRGEGLQPTPLEAAATPRTMPETIALSPGIVHPPCPAVLHARSTRAAPGCNAGGVRIISGKAFAGIKKAEEAPSGGRDGRRAFDRHSTDRLLTTNEQLAKKSGPRSRK